MDIRSFFGGVPKSAVSPSPGPKKASTSDQSSDLNVLKKKSIDKEKNVKQPLKHVPAVKKQPEKSEEKASDESILPSRRKRLKKVVDSDDDFSTSSPASNRKEVTIPLDESPKVKVRHLLWDNDDGIPKSPSDNKLKSSELQLDIECYTTNDKRLINPAANINTSSMPSVDLDSYLHSIGLGKSSDANSVPMSHTSPKSNEPVDSVKVDEKRSLPEVTSALKSPKKSSTQMTSNLESPYPKVSSPTQIISTQSLLSPSKSPYKPRHSLHTGVANSPKASQPLNLFDDDETLPSSPVKSPKEVTPHGASNVNKEKVVGMRFVFTGVLDAIDRDSVVELVRSLGGLTTGSVSSKTNYLVYGEKLEDGRHYTTGSKYKKALEFNKTKDAGIQLLNESEFLALIDYQNVSSRLTAVKTIPDESVHTIATSTDNTSLPLCEKYRPIHLTDLIGNEANIRKVVDWLKSWSPGSLPACALLSGPPGVGKTTTAKIVAAECGYECVEFNASDLRNKSAVEKISMLVTGGQSFSFLGECRMKKSLVLLDEIDGMGAGDRGGLQAVVALLPKARCPIICICNDRHNQKMTTLGGKSLDVRFSSPTLMQFRARIASVCAAEGITVPQDTVAQLYEQGGGDFRHALNAIEFNSLGDSGSKGHALSGSDAKDIGHTKNLFEATGRLFSARSGSTEKRYRELEQIFFIDYNMMPLMAQENYIKFIPVNNRALSILQALSQSFVEADRVEEFLKRTQSFSLLPDLAILSSILPAMVISTAGGSCRERLMFPQYLGRFSTTSKNKRFLSDIGKHMGHRSLIRSYPLVIDGYLDLLYMKIMGELSKGDVDATAEMIEGFGLNKELAVDALVSLRLKSLENFYDKIDTRKKTALTRRLNEQTVKLAPTKRKKEKIDYIVDDDADAGPESDTESSDSDSGLLKKNTRAVKKRATTGAASRRGKK
ncbi:Replication factor RFC1 C terminal domain family protein [Babesia bovis T2Bo]|uniref:Replication factor C subunit 1 n=1 Tax=Babesia bovis TaxID=5865 RepID=A7AMJ0_BABBO|nr:Replication factor RFC1 C terminal domain family protein [Babesia bovis T2Bo]EDO07774.1 Replication factor RFC1 C terminal domain family protein [Babesia bovis T2Bo]|eukprot:XP_001611342.1 hypothetical protein [Babesia bovis T2Bo]